MLKFVAILLSALFVATYANGGPPQPLTNANPIIARSDVSLANFLLARSDTASPPASMQCFNIYLPILQASSDQWAVDYQKCLNTSDNERNIVLARASEQQQNLSTDAAGVCAYIGSCNANTEALSALDCYSKLSTNTLSTIYTVSNNASDALSIIRQELSNIEALFERCTNASERAYVERSAKIYDALDHCLKFGPPATVATPTAAPITTPPTTTPPTITPPTTAAVFLDYDNISEAREAPGARSLAVNDSSSNKDRLSAALSAWLKRYGGGAN